MPFRKEKLPLSFWISISVPGKLPLLCRGTRRPRLFRLEHDTGAHLDHAPVLRDYRVLSEGRIADVADGFLE